MSSSASCGRCPVVCRNCSGRYTNASKTQRKRMTISPILPMYWTDATAALPVGDARWIYLNLPELFRAVYERIEDAAQTNDHLTYIADVLNGRDGDLWIDFNHLTPPGNAMVAEEMLKLLKIEQRPANNE